MGFDPTQDIAEPEEVELEMIDHGSKMGESTDESGEPVWVLRCAFEDFGTLQEGLRGEHQVHSTALEHV